MTHRHRPPRSRGAAAAVEFALVLPVLVTLMVGLWEVGRIIQVQQVLSNAAREGARVAAQGQTINSTSAPDADPRLDRVAQRHRRRRQLPQAGQPERDDGRRDRRVRLRRRATRP